MFTSADTIKNIRVPWSYILEYPGGPSSISVKLGKFMEYPGGPSSISVKLGKFMDQ